MPRRLLLGSTLVALFILQAASLRAQDTSLSERWQRTFTDQSYLWDVRLVELTGDTLMVRSRDSLILTPMARITELRLLPETILRVGDGHRSGIGALSDNNVRVVDMRALAPDARRKILATILSSQATGH